MNLRAVSAVPAAALDAPPASPGSPPVLVGPGGGREALLVAARAELVEHGHSAISLRAVARRAGVSHAAPKYHFHDRAGLLTAVAGEGFTSLAAALRHAVDVAGAASATDGSGRELAALGRSYIDFGLANPALFDLMFRPSELHPADPALQAAQGEAIGVLVTAVVRLVPAAPTAGFDLPPLALISWALVHGLVVLTRDGGLASATGSPSPQAAADLARGLTDVFTNQITRTVQTSDTDRPGGAPVT